MKPPFFLGRSMPGWFYVLWGYTWLTFAAASLWFWFIDYKPLLAPDKEYELSDVLISALLAIFHFHAYWLAYPDKPET